MDDALLVGRFEASAICRATVSASWIGNGPTADAPRASRLPRARARGRGCRRPPPIRRSRQCADGSASPVPAPRVKARETLGVRRKSSATTLIATSRPSFVSWARYTSPIPPAPRRDGSCGNRAADPRANYRGVSQRPRCQCPDRLREKALRHLCMGQQGLHLLRNAFVSSAGSRHEGGPLAGSWSSAASQRSSTRRRRSGLSPRFSFELATARVLPAASRVHRVG